VVGHTVEAVQDELDEVVRVAPDTRRRFRFCRQQVRVGGSVPGEPNTVTGLRLSMTSTHPTVFLRSLHDEDEVHPDGPLVGCPLVGDVRRSEVLEDRLLLAGLVGLVGVSSAVAMATVGYWLDRHYELHMVCVGVHGARF
jgi:hypothetical protein